MHDSLNPYWIPHHFQERGRERLQTPLWLVGNEGEVEQHHTWVDGQRDLFPIRDDILACHSSLNSSKKPCERQGRSGSQHRPPAYHTLGLNNFPVVVLLQRGYDHGIPGIRGCRGSSLHPEGLHYAEAGEGRDGAGVWGRGSRGLNCVSWGRVEERECGVHPQDRHCDKACGGGTREAAACWMRWTVLGETRLTTRVARRDQGEWLWRIASHAALRRGGGAAFFAGVGVRRLIRL